MVKSIHRILLFALAGILVVSMLFISGILVPAYSTTVNPPIQVTSSLVTSSSARISWTNPSGTISGFKIEKSSPVGGSWSTVANTTNSTNRYDLTGLAGNTQYNIRISTNSSGTFSSPSFAYNFYTLPNPPTSLVAAQIQPSTEHLSWVTPAGNTTSIGYKIERTINAGTSWSLVKANTGNSTTKYNDTGLTAGLRYGYRVSTVEPNSTQTTFQMNDTVASDSWYLNGTRQIIAEFVSPSSALVGKSIDSITLDLKKKGSPTGTAQVGIINTDRSIKQLFGNIDVSTLTTTFAQYTFSLNGTQTYQIASNDRIGIKYTGGSAANNPLVAMDLTNQFDGTNSYHTQYTTLWQNFTDQDPYTVLKLHTYTNALSVPAVYNYGYNLVWQRPFTDTFNKTSISGYFNTTVPILETKMHSGDIFLVGADGDSIANGRAMINWIGNNSKNFPLGSMVNSSVSYGKINSLLHDVNCLLGSCGDKHLTDGLDYIIYDGEVGSEPLFSYNQTISDQLYDAGKRAVDNYNGNTTGGHGHARFVIQPPFGQTGSGFNSNVLFNSWDWGLTTSHVGNKGVIQPQYQEYVDFPSVNAMVNDTATEIADKNTNVQFWAQLGADAKDHTPARPASAAQYVEEMKSPLINAFFIFWDHYNTTSITDFYNYLNRFDANGTTIPSDSRDMPVGVVDAIDLKNDRTAQNLIGNDSNPKTDIVFGRWDESQTFSQFKAWKYRFIDAHSQQNITSDLNNVTSWTAKPTDIYLNYTAGTTPSNELNNITANIAYASTRAHNAGLNFTFAPDPATSYYSNYINTNESGIDKLVINYANYLPLNGSQSPYQNKIGPLVKYWISTSPSFNQTSASQFAGLMRAGGQMAVFQLPDNGQLKTLRNTTNTINTGTDSPKCSSDSGRKVTTLGTFTPSWNASSISHPNVLIIPIDIKMTQGTNSNETVSVYNTAGTLLAKSYFKLSMLTGGNRYFTLLANDTNAPANPTYKIYACSTANHPTADLELLGMHGLSNVAYINATNQTVTGTTQVAKLTTTFPVNSKVVVMASVELNNTNKVTNFLTGGTIQILNGTNKTLASNPYTIGMGKVVPTLTKYTFLVGLDNRTNSANATYRVNVTGLASAKINAHVTLLAFTVPNATASNTNMTSAFLGTSSTSISQVIPNLPQNKRYGLISAIQYKDFDTTNSTMSILAGKEDVNESNSLVNVTMSRFTLKTFGNANTVGGDDIIHVQVYGNKTIIHNPGAIIIPFENLNRNTAYYIYTALWNINNETNTSDPVAINNIGLTDAQAQIMHGDLVWYNGNTTPPAGSGVYTKAQQLDFAILGKHEYPVLSFAIPADRTP